MLNYSEYTKIKESFKKKNYTLYNSFNFPEDPRFSDPNWFLDLISSGNIPKISIQIGTPSFWIPTAELFLSSYYPEKLVISWSKRGLEYVNSESIDPNIYLDFYLKMVRKYQILPHRVQTRSEALRLMLENEDWYMDEIEKMSEEEYNKFMNTRRKQEGEIHSNYLACDNFLDELVVILTEIREMNEEKGKELFNIFRNHYFSMAKEAIERLNKLN